MVFLFWDICANISCYRLPDTLDLPFAICSNKPRCRIQSPIAPLHRPRNTDNSDDAIDNIKAKILFCGRHLTWPCTTRGIWTWRDTTQLINKDAFWAWFEQRLNFGKISAFVTLRHWRSSDIVSFAVIKKKFKRFGPDLSSRNAIAKRWVGDSNGVRRSKYNFPIPTS